MEITQTLPQIPDTQNYTVTLNTIPHTSSNTRCHLNISLHHFVSNNNKPKFHESCSTKSKLYSMLQINLILKTPFDLRHLTTSSFTLYFSQPSEGTQQHSEETTQRKHTYVTTIPRYQQQKLWLQNGSPSLNNNNHFIHC